jgi:hypothetical protein
MPLASASATESSRQSARRLIGTQVSVLMARQPGRLDGGKVGVVPRRPQAGALFGRAGPFKGVAAELAGDLLHGLGLLLHAGGRAVELHQQHGFFAQAQLGCAR